MVPLINAVIAHIKAETTPFAPFKVGMLDTAPKGIAIRMIPSSPGSRFMDRSRVKAVQFQIIGKSPDQMEVMAAMDAFEDLLELSNGELNVPGYDFILCEASNNTAYVEKTSANEYIYSTFYRAELSKRG